MRIVSILEKTVPLEGNISNAVVSFAEHDVSIVAVTSDVMRNGKPVVGFGFNSIGRFAQGGILRDRVFPRLLAAEPDALLDTAGARFDPAKTLSTAMRNEKPGGHGDRASAVGAVELAIWDLNAKLNDEPAYVTIANHFGRAINPGGIPVYAAGGYYYPPGSSMTLRDELRAYQDLGFSSFKMKIGGASLCEDMVRIKDALAIAGDGSKLAVDANGRFDLPTSLEYARAIQPLGLRWLEEAGDPLDFELNSLLTGAYPGAVATGENLFSSADVKNLINFGGMRPSKDIFQMDAGLSYGLTEYAKMIALLEGAGFDRRFAHPHGGHLINLHIAMGLGLGGCEAYPGVFQPFGGYPVACALCGGMVSPSDAPGFGLEQKPQLRPIIEQMMCQS